MASNARKQGGRVTPKGTKPPVKTPKGGGGSARSPEPAEMTPNRQMRRAGFNPEPANPQQAGRMRIVLIAAGAVTALAVIALIVVFRLSGTWIGLLGLAAGMATGLAVASGKTWAADKGRPIAIGLAVLGVVVTAVGVSGVVEIHWPFGALIGCGLGALFAELATQQMTAPPGPPQSALALLRRGGAQCIEAPSTGNCLWATPDGRIRVIVGATVGDGVGNDKILTDKHVRKARQRGTMVARRMASAGVEQGVTCVVDASIATIKDGDDLICSSAGLSKALAR